MKKIGSVWRILFIYILLISSFAKATVNFYDGQRHIIDYVINDDVVLDDFSSGTSGTYLDLINGGIIKGNLTAHNNNTISVNGGIVEGSVTIWSGEVIVTSGSINGWVWSDNGSCTIVNGGVVGSIISLTGFAMINGGKVASVASDFGSQVFVSGGISSGGLYAKDDGIIYLDGTDFKVNGIPIGYQHGVSEFVNMTDDNVIRGSITGVLRDGTQLDSMFEIHNIGGSFGADIIVIPEPTTCLLFLGSLSFLRRKPH